MNEMKVGDVVLYLVSEGLVKGTVLKFGKKNIKISFRRSGCMEDQKYVPLEKIATLTEKFVFVRDYTKGVNGDGVMHLERDGATKYPHRLMCGYRRSPDVTIHTTGVIRESDLIKDHQIEKQSQLAAAELAKLLSK